MKKSIIAAALVAASAVAAGFAVNANASLFSSDSTPAPAPLSFQSVYDSGLHASTYGGKATVANPLAYEPSSALLGLRLGDSLSERAPACDKTNLLKLANPCVLRTDTSGAAVGGLHDPLNMLSTIAYAYVGTDASGRIDAIVVPMIASDVLARYAAQGLLNRFGKPTSITATEIVWNLPDGAQAKLVYEDDRLVHRNNHGSVMTKALYAAVYSKDGAGSVSDLLNADWSHDAPTK